MRAAAAEEEAEELRAAKTANKSSTALEEENADLQRQLEAQGAALAAARAAEAAARKEASAAVRAAEAAARKEVDAAARAAEAAGAQREAELRSTLHGVNKVGACADAGSWVSMLL